jgi:hypothetical protein
MIDDANSVEANAERLTLPLQLERRKVMVCLRYF